jgi:uncharacterized protein (TIGR02391 family)
VRRRSKAFWWGICLAAFSAWTQVDPTTAPAGTASGRAVNAAITAGIFFAMPYGVRWVWTRTAQARERRREVRMATASASAPPASPELAPTVGTSAMVIDLRAPDLPERDTRETLRLDDLHQWVREAAAPLWRSGHFRQAVEEAAKAVNAATQSKLGRYDKSEWNLVADAFSEAPPQPGVPRLRPAGDTGTPTWRSLRDGANAFARGCYQGIRNVAAHQTVNWDRATAFEYLVAFSVLARWIDQCGVDRAPVSSGVRKAE